MDLEARAVGRVADVVKGEGALQEGNVLLRAEEQLDRLPGDEAVGLQGWDGGTGVCGQVGRWL